MFYDLILSMQQASYQLSNPAWFLSMSITLAVLPIAICLMTSFVKLSIVLGILKNALGMQHAPSAMVTMALSLSLTMLIMQPVINESLELGKSIQLEKLSKSATSEIIETFKPLLKPWREFLLVNSGKKELSVLSQLVPDSNREDPDFLLLIPGFMLSELKEGFCMAFILLVPFLVIDLIVANILMGLGMMMLSPVLISLPIKLILFVTSDAWLLISRALIKSYMN